MNKIGYRNHTSNPAPPLSLNCAAGVILPCSPGATSPLCDSFWTRHCRCMNLHLCLTHTQVILHHFVTNCLARIYMNLPLLHNVTISRPATDDLPFLSPADTIIPYMACMVPLLSLSVTPLVRQSRSCMNLMTINR
jgi:hypothetical protein